MVEENQVEVTPAAEPKLFRVKVQGSRERLEMFLEEAVSSDGYSAKALQIAGLMLDAKTQNADPMSGFVLDISCGPGALCIFVDTVKISVPEGFTSLHDYENFELSQAKKG